MLSMVIGDDSTLTAPAEGLQRVKVSHASIGEDITSGGVDGSDGSDGSGEV
jgi:hypothetical protein